MDVMEDGELRDGVEEIEEEKGLKRTQSMIEEDDDREEALDIKPPPVVNKKHKRHHKKHKNRKEEKKKARHRSRSPMRDYRDGKRRVLNEHKPKIQPSVKVNDNYENRTTRKSPDGRRSPEQYKRPNFLHQRQPERGHRADVRVSPHDRPKTYEYKSRISEYTSKNDADRHVHSGNSNYAHKDEIERSSSYTKTKGGRGYGKKEDLRDRITGIPPERPLLERRYDNDDHDRKWERPSRDDRSKHERSKSAYSLSSTVSSKVTLHPPRKSDTSVDDARKRNKGDRPSSNPHKDTSSKSSSKTLDDEKPPRISRVLDKKDITSTETSLPEDTTSDASSAASDSSGSRSSDDDDDDDEANGDEPSQKRSKQKMETSLDVSKEEDDENESTSADDDDSSTNPDVDGSDAGDMSVDEEGDDESDSNEETENESSGESIPEADPRSRFDSPASSAEESEESGRMEGEEEEEEEESEGSDVEHVLSPDELPPVEKEPELPFYLPAVQGCRSVDEFQCLNRIEEGTYGVVYRAKDKTKDRIVALKRLKMEKEREGFPITSLREVCTLLKAHHPNIVRVQEIVVGSNVDKIYIVMDYVEHDLKSLMETMKQPFLVGEVKTLMIQLLNGIHHLHDNWILHRDLKTSNLLLSHKGILKIGDFGLAREYGSPLKPYTPIVVTLWYRCPELLLGAKEYSCAVDMWSVGCIFAELLSKKPLFPGKSEIMQLNLIFKELGTPSEKIWPGYSNLPVVKKTTFTEYPYNTLRKRFGLTEISEKGFDLLNRFLTYCPEKRATAYKALEHEWFMETPKPVEPSMFPTWPAKSEQMRQKKAAGSGGGSPKAPAGGMDYDKLLNEEEKLEKLGFQLTLPKHGMSKHGTGFSLRF